MEANHPYIIKVSEDIVEFAVANVEIEPDVAEVNKGTILNPKAFIGNYVAGTTIDNGCLFLNNNKFWYSLGATKIKAFRAYFDFCDILPNLGSQSSEARAFISFDSCLTNINIQEKSPLIKGAIIYDLQGRRVYNPMNAGCISTSKLNKGIYIVNGRKVVK